MPLTDLYSATVKFDDPTTHPKTWKEICMLISETLTFRRKGAAAYVTLTWEQIWNSSPNGELFQVAHWAEDVYIQLETQRRVAAGESEEGVGEDIMKRFKKLYKISEDEKL